MLQRYLGDFLDKFKIKLRGREEIRLQPEGFAIYKKDEEIANLRLDDITKIIAFKRDLFAMDLVCFEFHIATNSKFVYEANEDVDGFSQLINQLERAFPTFDRDWRQKVILPPFAENRTVVYQK